MSLFFDYFKKTLNWLLIQKPGAIAAIVHGGAMALDTVRDKILWVRLQASPETCEDEYVAAHGAARGVFQRQGESLEKYRARVVRAYVWHLLGGKKTGLPKMLEHYGYALTSIYNLRDEDPERWAEFKINLPLPENIVINEADIKNIDELVNDQKPARSKLAAIKVIRQRKHKIMITSVVRISIKVTVAPYVPASSADTSELFCATAMIISIKCKINNQ